MLTISDVAKSLIFDDKGCFSCMTDATSVEKGDSDVTAEIFEFGIDFEKGFISQTHLNLFQSLCVLREKTDGRVGLGEDDCVHELGDEIILDRVRFHPTVVLHVSHCFDSRTRGTEGREIRRPHTQYDLSDLLGIFFRGFVIGGIDGQ